MPPKIGIVEAEYTFENYKYAIKKHGGEVVQLNVGQNSDEYINQIHGLLLPGGKDIYPDYYCEDPHPKTKCYDNKEKDEFEKALFRKAMEKDMPVFGICRGIQIMNVVMDGSLYQHIPEHVPLQFPDFPKHKVKGRDETHEIKIQPGSRLHQITDESIAEVTSSHHQAVKVIGKGLVVTAQSKDGIIEAMEFPSKSNPFVIGVQYHPERMWINKN